MNQSVYNKRLLKLAAFIEKLPEKKFDIHSMVAKKNKHGDCGTVCCIAGWLPKVFPGNWYWKKTVSENLYPVRRGSDAADSICEAMTFLNIPAEERGLFFSYGYPIDGATPRAAAERLRMVAQKAKVSP